MGKFARLFELENDEQVLVTLDYNSEEDKHEVSIRTDLNNCVANIKAGFKSEDEAIAILERYSIDDAIAFRNDMCRNFN